MIFKRKNEVDNNIQRRTSSEILNQEISTKGDADPFFEEIISNLESFTSSAPAPKAAVPITEYSKMINDKLDRTRRAAIAKNHPASAMLVKVQLHTSFESIIEWAKENGAIVEKIPDYYIVVTYDSATYAKAFLMFLDAESWEETWLIIYSLSTKLIKLIRMM